MAYHTSAQPPEKGWSGWVHFDDLPGSRPWGSPGSGGLRGGPDTSRRGVRRGLGPLFRPPWTLFEGPGRGWQVCAHGVNHVSPSQIPGGCGALGPGFLLTGFTSLAHPVQPMTWLVRVSKGGHKSDPLGHDLLGIYPRGVQVGHPFLDPVLTGADPMPTRC